MTRWLYDTLSKDLECPGKGSEAEHKAEHVELQFVYPWIRKYISDMRNELKILSKLKHPGLIQEFMTRINSRSCELLICVKIQQLEITDSVTRSERDFDFSNSFPYCIQLQFIRLFVGPGIHWRPGPEISPDRSEISQCFQS